MAASVPRRRHAGTTSAAATSGAVRNTASCQRTSTRKNTPAASSTATTRVWPNVTARRKSPVTASAPTASHQSGITCTAFSWVTARLPIMTAATASTGPGRTRRQANKARNSPAPDSSAIHARKTTTEVVSRVTGAASSPGPRLCIGGITTGEGWALVWAM